MTLTTAAMLIALLLIFSAVCFALAAFCNMLAALCYLASIRTPAGPRGDETARSTVVNVNNGPAEFHELPPGFMPDDDDISGEEWKANPR
jgi:hypothetical protein